MKKVIVMLFACSSTALLFSSEKKDLLKKSQENLEAIVAVSSAFDLRRSQSPSIVESTEQGIRRSPSTQSMYFDSPCGASKGNTFPTYNVNSRKPAVFSDDSNNFWVGGCP